MNTQSRVFKKLAEVEKVELSVQKVQLNTMDEADSLISKSNKKALEASGFVEYAQKAY